LRREIARAPAPSAAGRRNLNLLPVDIDFVHPATGEMNESRETSEGGYIAIRKEVKRGQSLLFDTGKAVGE
jgi:hypothetical protein